MLRFILLTGITFVAMEFVSYLAHRYVYHKLLWVFHRSHHQPRTGPFEWNDVFPLFFSSVCIVLMYTAVQSPNGADLLAISIGIASYGTIYFIIHDLYVHRRMKNLTFRIPYLQQVKKAHMIHHRFGGEPYGLLLFPLPRHLKKELDEAEVKA